MVKDFLTRGSAAALSAFIPSVRPALILAIFMAFYGDEVQATVGLTASYFGIAFVVTAGFTVAAVFALAKHVSSPVSDCGPILVGEFRVGSAAAVVLSVLAVIAGLLLPPIIGVEAALFYAFWFTSIGSLLIMPFGATLSGTFQARNRDLENLLLSVGATLIQLGAALAVGLAGASPLHAVLTVGLTGFACDLLALLYRSVFLDRSHGLGARLVLAGIREFLAKPLLAVRQFPDRTKGALDGLILMTVFTVAGTVATQNSARDGAIVVTVVAILRSFVIPLKQYGLVGGRLIRQREALGEDAVRNFRVLALISFAILAATALSFVVLRASTTAFSSIPWLIVLLMVAQLCAEPITGFGFAAHKILSAPSFGVKALAIISFCVTIPVLLVLPSINVATAEVIWLAVFGSRVLFATAIAFMLVNWSRATITVPA